MTMDFVNITPTYDQSTSNSTIVLTATKLTTIPQVYYPTTPAVVARFACLGTLSVVNIFGNSLNLAAIRLTPRLQTKTNYILASLMVADLVIGVYIAAYLAIHSVITFFGGPCKHNVLVAANQGLQKGVIWMSFANMVVVGIDRYVSILHPLVYEARMTYTVIRRMIVGAWAIAILFTATFYMWFINFPSGACPIIPTTYHAIETAIYLFIAPTFLFLYGSILREALKQRAKIAEISFEARSQDRPPSISTALFTVSGKISADQGCSHAASHPAGVVTFQNTTAAPGEARARQIKSRRREYKAVYLIAAIVGSLLVLWFPFEVGRLMLSLGDMSQDVLNLVEIGGGLGTFHSSANWIIYAAVSRSFRRAYKNLFATFCTRSYTQ